VKAILFGLLMFAVILATGHLLARPIVAWTDGKNIWGDDPVKSVVATRSEDLATWFYGDHPFERLVITDVRTKSVELAPGSCTTYPPDAVEHGDYRARLQLYTIFGVPLREVVATCGGNAI
jgi:hypothetical protein